MSELIKIAVDAMGGDGSPKKVIDGIIQNHKKNKENYFKIFGNQDEIINLVDKVESSKNTKFTLAGCLVFREKNQVILTREIKN